MDDTEKTPAQLLQELSALRQQVATQEAARTAPSPSQPATPEADAFASAVLETTDALIVVLDTQGRMLRFNRACEQTTGYTFAEVRGKRVWELLLMAEEIEPVKAVFGNLQAGHFPSRFENIWVTKAGQRRHIRWSNTAMLDDEGAVAYIIGTGIDITTQMQTEVARSESEARFRSIVEASIQGIYIHQEGVIQFANPAMARMFGYDSPSALVGQPYQVTIANHERGRLEGYRTARLRGDSAPVQYQYQAVRADGSFMWLECLASPLSWQGQPAILAAFVDISARKQAEAALRESQRASTTLMSNLPGMAYRSRKDRQWTMEFASEGCVALTGYQPSDLIDNNKVSYAQLIHPDDREAVWHAVQDAVEQQAPFQVVYRMTTATGQERWVWEQGRDVVSADGRTSFIEGFIIDISARRQAEKALQRSHDNLEQRVRDRTAALEAANEEVRRFAYIVSHDLRAPLINLKGFANELRDSCQLVKAAVSTVMAHLDDRQQAEVTRALEEDVPEALSFIDSSVSRMDGLIHSILHLSRAGNRELSIESVDTTELVQTLLQTLTHQLAERGAHVDIGSLPEVQADRTAMEQVFGNLLSNAVKYLELGRPGKITITAEPHDAGTTFRVQDNGRGIAEDDIPKVVELFRRVGRQDTPGEGMGLAYVQALVRRHGGELHCESVLGVGTTFSFTLANVVCTENEPAC